MVGYCKYRCAFVTFRGTYRDEFATIRYFANWKHLDQAVPRPVNIRREKVVGPISHAVDDEQDERDDMNDSRAIL